MDAGQLPDFANTPTSAGLPVPSAVGAPVSHEIPEEDFAILPDHNPLLIQSESLVASVERREKFASLGIAVLIHAALVAVLAWIVVSVATEPQPEFVVASTTADVVTKTVKKEYTQSLKQKPSSPSASSTQLMASIQPSKVAIPVVDQITDNPMGLGSAGFGDGMGGFGDGDGAGSFMGIPDTGKRMVLVIDTSTSMPQECTANGIAAIRAEITRTVSALPAGTEFNIICYGNMADGLFPKPAPASPERKHQVDDFMKGYFGVGSFPRTRTESFGDKGKDLEGVSYVPIQPDKVSGLKGTSGGSRLDLGLVAAFDQKATTIFLMTDGAPSTTKDGKRLSEREIVRLVADEADRVYGKDARPTVHCISINGIGESILKDVAKTFKGKFKIIEPAKL